MTARHKLGPLVLATLMLPAFVAAGDVVEYYHLDALGNVRLITDQNGNVVERHDYYLFGEECLTGPCASNPGVGAGQPRKFTGKERDAETGLDYFGARYYGSKIGRFTTVDPVYTWNDNLLDPQRWNRYAYGRNNPLRYVDPDGKNPVVAAIVLGGLFLLNNATNTNVTTGPTNATIMPNSVIVAGGYGFAIGGGRLAAATAFEEATGLPTPTRLARGGAGPVLKGKEGVERSIEAAKARGETILGQEITVDAASARTRLDLATKTPEGRLKFIECKNGPCADLSPNQRAAFPDIRAQGGVPRGGNAAKAGLKPDEPIGPTEVVVEKH